MRNLLRPTLVSFLLLSVVTGILYPAFVTGAAQALFPDEANGSLIKDGRWQVGDGGAPSSAVCHPPSVFRGSLLIGQNFTEPRYFWSRPSATGPVPYNAAASSGSNLGPNNPAQVEAIRARIATLRAADPGNTSPIPVDLLTASGSGLDPHISPAAAEYQVGRVARARGLSPDSVHSLVRAASSGRQFGVLGEPVVNVLRLNLALDRSTPAP
jgi:K+-transporting ATPase ATPase C chain